MMVTKTAKLTEKENKGQRAVIVGVLSKLTAPISLEDLTAKVLKTGAYHGKGTKGHVNSWALEHVGNEGSVRYHLRALAAEKRVTLVDGVALTKKVAKAKKEKAPIVEPQVAA